MLDRQITSYAQLLQLVDAAALEIETCLTNSGYKGLQHRLHIAIATKNCVEVAVWYLFAARDGHMLCLLDPDWPQQTMAYALDLYQPHVLIRQTVNNPGSVKVDVSGVNDLPNTDEVVLKDMFFAGFTSGSSGLPKAFVRTAHSWVVSIATAADEFATNTDSVMLAPGPLSHGLSFFTLAECFYHGATFVSQSRFSATACLSLLSNSIVNGSEGGDLGKSRLPVAVTAAVLVPSMLHAILERAQKGADTVGNLGANAKNLRVITAGAKLSATDSQLLETVFPSCLLSEYYGASELSFVTVSHAEEELDAASVGRPCQGVELLIEEDCTDPTSDLMSLKSDADNDADGDGCGTVVVSSSMLASGYLQRIGSQEKSTLEVMPLALIRGRATVGDRGYINAQGCLFLLDREDRMIKSRGFKVYPLVVESVIRDFFLNTFEGTSPTEIVVLGVEDDFQGTAITAILQAELHSLPDVHKQKTLLTEHCRKYLKDHELPSRLFLAPSLPMTSSGKVAYRQLRKNLQEYLQSSLPDYVQDHSADSESSLHQIEAGFSGSE